MELPCTEATCGAAGLPNKLIRVGLILQSVQCHLYWAVYVIAEFAGSVFSVSFKRHVASLSICPIRVINCSISNANDPLRLLKTSVHEKNIGLPVPGV